MSFPPRKLEETCTFILIHLIFEFVLSPQDEQSDDDSGDYIEPEADETLDHPQSEFLINLNLFVYLPQL